MDVSPKVLASVEQAVVQVDGISHRLRILTVLPDQQPPQTPAFASFSVETQSGHELLRVMAHIPLEQMDDAQCVVRGVVEAMRLVLVGQRPPAARVMYASPRALHDYPDTAFRPVTSESSSVRRFGTPRR